MRLFYQCPKRKCRHTWQADNPMVIDGNCPRCGAARLAPVDIERETNEHEPNQTAGSLTVN